MCLVLALVMSLVANAVHPSLSLNIGVGPSIFSPRLVSSCLRNMTSCASANRTIYYTSAAESATKVCNLFIVLSDGRSTFHSNVSFPRSSCVSISKEVILSHE